MTSVSPFKVIFFILWKFYEYEFDFPHYSRSSLKKSREISEHFVIQIPLRRGNFEHSFEDTWISGVEALRTTARLGDNGSHRATEQTFFFRQCRRQLMVKRRREILPPPVNPSINQRSGTSSGFVHLLASSNFPLEAMIHENRKYDSASRRFPGISREIHNGKFIDVLGVLNISRFGSATCSSELVTHWKSNLNRCTAGNDANTCITLKLHYELTIMNQSVTRFIKTC